MIVKNPIQITSLMLFSMGYFVIGILNYFHIHMDATYYFFSILNNYHVFEFSLVAGVIFSIIQNYHRARIDSSTRLYDAVFLFGWDFALMLLGVFASQLVLLSFTYSQDHNLHLITAAFSTVVIIANICRKPLLNFLAWKIH